MNRSPGQVGSSLHQGDYPLTNAAPGRQATPSAREPGNTNVFVDVIGTSHVSEASHDSFDPGYGVTNDPSQYHIGYCNFSAEKTDLHNRHPSESAILFAGQNDQGFLRGIEGYATSFSPATEPCEVAGGRPSFLQNAPSAFALSQSRNTFECIENQPHSSSQNLIAHVAPSYEPMTERQTRYRPFQHLFGNAQQARDHRRKETLFGRSPYLVEDYTIADVENDRNKHIERIYNAMTSGEAARDNTGSIAMKRWVSNAHYPPDLVEAFAHKVFDCLIQQVKEGFRGWEHNDYVADERKGDEVDREVDCAGRLNNIILALEQEKTICEDIMNSACQIRMFVNAPRAYANRKHQNRVGNSKRGKSKDAPDLNPRPTKTQRIGGRRTRARSSAAPEMPSSRGSTPQNQQGFHRTSSAMPYFSSPASHSLSLSPISSDHPAPHSTPLNRPIIPIPRTSFTQRSPMSSIQPRPHFTQTPTFHAAMPHLRSPNNVPLAINNNFSPSPTPNDAKPPMLSNWQDMFHFGETTGMNFGHNTVEVDPQLSQWNFSGGNDNMFAQHHDGFVCLSSVEQTQPGSVAEESDTTLFRQYPDNQHGLPHGSSTEGQPGRQDQV